MRALIHTSHSRCNQRPQERESECPNFAEVPAEGGGGRQHWIRNTLIDPYPDVFPAGSVPNA